MNALEPPHARNSVQPSLGLKGAPGEDFSANGFTSLNNTLQRDSSGFFHVDGR
jgi:hypothetical protein